jgi:signal transduction histidine kinase
MATQLLGNSMVGDRERDLLLRVDEQLWVMADQETLVQVVLNLLSNACKYSEPGTSVEIAARTPDATAASATRTTAGEDQVEIAIRDHGLGIPPEQIPLLFQRFVRLDRDIASATPGTGLGLAICRTYVESMGGKIWVESEGIPGEGSTFVFSLALAQVPAAEKVEVSAHD